MARYWRGGGAGRGHGIRGAGIRGVCKKTGGRDGGTVFGGTRYSGDSVAFTGKSKMLYCGV